MLNQRIADLAAAVEQSRGGTATVWEYSASLGELSIRITWPGVSENIHLVCNGCARLEATTCWSNVDLAYKQSEDGTFTLIDQNARLLVHCGQIRAFRNVEPMFAAP